MTLQYMQGGRLGYPADSSFYLLFFIWRINGTAVFVRGRVGYLPDLSFCPGPLLKPLNKLLRIFAPADV